MRYSTRLIGTLLGIALLIGNLTATEPALLRSVDVDRVMNQIFDQHVDKKGISADILRNSFRVYIDQFDPERVYLLQEEVSPYLDLNEEDVQHILNQYRSGDFSSYEKLNDLIQQSIIRSRNLRKQLETNSDQLFYPKAGAMHHEFETDLKTPFSKDIASLQERLKDYLRYIISSEKRIYGDKLIMENEKQILSGIESVIRTSENRYLFQNEKGQSITGAEKENLLTLHILKALASSLDAHTSFFDPSEAYDMRVRLQKGYKGIGVVLEKVPEGVLIEELVKGGPADKSGLIHQGDIIISVNGTSTAGMDIDSISRLIRETDGQSLKLIITRGDAAGATKTLNMSIRMEKIAIDEGRAQHSYEKFGNGIIGKITLNAFYQGDGDVTSEKDVAKAIKELDKVGNLRGLILDLRENSGGFLTQAVKVAGLFITNGIIVVSKYHNGEEVFYRDMDSKINYTGPLVILTSRATASAAEIVAQALQDYGIAVIVGDEQTYGKGTIQSQTVTGDNGSSLFKVTVGKYYTVSGKTPQIHGVKSDIVVPSLYAAMEIGEEHLDYALAEDQIPPSFLDKLDDIDPNLRPWYLRYYMPTLQHRQARWKNFIPLLKGNSEHRLTKNKDFQLYIQNLKPGEQDGNFGKEDFQMAEAVNIVKDMVLIDSREHVDGVGNVVDLNDDLKN